MGSIDDYESDYKAHISAANERAEQAEHCKTPEERRSVVAAAERAVEAAKDVIQLMELEGRSLPSDRRARLQAMLRGFRTEVSDLKSLLRELKSKSTAQQSDCIREELFAAHNGNGYGGGGVPNERSRMLANNDRIAAGTDRLKDVNAVTMDMEHTANSILGDLASQRETLMRSRNTLNFASAGLENSSRLLRSMARRAATNKLILYVVIGLIVALILFLMYTGMVSNPQTRLSPPTR